MARPTVSKVVGSEGLDVVDGEHLMLANDADRSPGTSWSFSRIGLPAAL
jgi:hypothetical protein